MLPFDIQFELLDHVKIYGSICMSHGRGTSGQETQHAYTYPMGIRKVNLNFCVSHLLFQEFPAK